jgi:hypothetical protein
MIEAVENLLIFFNQPLGLLAKLGDGQLLGGLLALLSHELSMAQCVLDIEKFLVCHLPCLPFIFYHSCGTYIVCRIERDKRGKIFSRLKAQKKQT